MTLIDRLLKDAPLATRREITPKLGFVLTILLAIVWLTRRYQRYDARKMRGHHDDKPVWKPFWMR